MVWLTDWHKYLTERVKVIPNGGTYLEIGTLNGCSLIAAYEGSKMSGNSINLIAIDWYFKHPLYWKAFEKLQKRLCYIPNLRYIKGTAGSVSDQVEDNSVDVLLEDADSEYNVLKEHVRLYWPKIKEGGMWLGHDYFTGPQNGKPSVKKVYDEVFGDDGTLMMQTLFVVEKVKGYRPKF